jgi:catechol 2,3-dioxygenase-like lactoylglutathione lyase family enzyme
MARPSLHHAGLVVADLERAASFYIDALDAQWLVRPMAMEPPHAGALLGGPEEMSFHVAMLGFGDEGFVELFCFDGEVKPPWLRPNGGHVPHVAFRVEDAAASLERAVAAGGTPVWEAPNEWGRGHTMYLRDPDDNLVELIDVPARTLIEDCLAMHPESTP